MKEIDTRLDTNMANIIVNKFANTLQSTIAYKTQLVYINIF